MSVYRSIDDYFLKKRGPNDRLTRRQDHRFHVREPAKLVFAIGKTTWLLATCSWTNVFLLLAPAALTLSATSNQNDEIFWLNYFALLSAFGLFRYGSEELSIPASRITGKIWDLAVEVLSLDTEIAVIALSRGQLELVKAYIVGKVVSVTLLTLGLCFLVAGVRWAECGFDQTIKSTFGSLLVTSIVPFGILALFPSGFEGSLTSPPVLSFSRAASIVLLLLFGFSHLFRYTHRNLYEEYEEDIVEVTEETENPRSGQLNTWIAIVIMIGSVVMTYFCALPILTVTQSGLVRSEAFIGFCLLPLLAEVAEIVRITRLAWSDRMQDALVAAASTGTATVLFVAPALCLLAWCLNQPMSLSLRLPEIVSFGGSVCIFNYLVQDGKSNWMEGAMSIGLYLVQVLAFWLCG